MSNNAAVLQSGYSIGEVADRVGVSVDTLRYYEKAGLLNGVARTESGRRLYSDDDCGWILFVRRLRGTAMPIGEIAEYAKMVQMESAARRSGEASSKHIVSGSGALTTS
jgi:DNA-binding transcriptional MerR regulator